jgi:hypothetical protein
MAVLQDTINNNPTCKAIAIATAWQGAEIAHDLKAQLAGAEAKLANLQCDNNEDNMIIITEKQSNSKAGRKVKKVVQDAAKEPPESPPCKECSLSPTWGPFSNNQPKKTATQTSDINMDNSVTTT